jgi:D-xylose 1-dehydrogenase (NADP+, D-xylono-1,5-lactone-forming)
MSTPFRFGVLGTGNIAGQFTRDVKTASRSAVAAVASRSPASAAAFADRYQLDPARAYGRYDALLDDDTVDAVYISLPNTLHAEWTLKALRAGKHVLCEKPLAMSQREAETMFAAADDAGKLLVEAFMYRAQPLTHKLVELVHAGAIGELRLVRASFCYRTHKIAGNVRFDPSLGGGALLDIGCYGLSFAQRFLGQPEQADVAGHVHDTGVDDYAAVTLRYPNGAIAQVSCAMTVQADNTALLCGTDGWIEVPIPWKPPAKGAQLVLKGQRPPKMDAPGTTPTAPGPETITVDAPCELYGVQADAFADCARHGVEPFMPAADSIALAGQLATLRKRLGLTY